MILKPQTRLLLAFIYYEKKSILEFDIIKLKANNISSNSLMSKREKKLHL